MSSCPPESSRLVLRHERGDEQGETAEIRQENERR